MANRRQSPHREKHVRPRQEPETQAPETQVDANSLMRYIISPSRLPLPNFLPNFAFQASSRADPTPETRHNFDEALMFPRRFRLLAVPTVLMLIAGCTHNQRSNTARTGVEQLLISNAIDQSLEKVNFHPFGGHAVYLEEKYADSVDKAYLVGSVRHRMLAAGAYLVDAPDDAEIVVELRSGGVGTDTSESFIGVPEITLPGMLTLPEVRFLERTSQTGTAKIGLVAYDARTKRVLGQGGTSLSKSTDNNWFVAGIGPFQEGSVKREIIRSTKGTTASPDDSVPRQVAFESPGPLPAGRSSVQFASGEEAATE